MATIDDKVVAMSFESSRFESGVNKTISSLDKLKAALHFPNAGKGLQDLDAAAKRVNFSNISEGVQKISRALEALRLVAIGVMSQLATQAIRAGGRFVKAFTLDPIKAGFAEYSTNLQAVQTILANTQAAGVGLKEVNATLRELNEYSDRTIYNFSQMAKNIGTFTAAGVELKTATASIKGIANLAALSGSNAEQASTAMYQLSQAIAAGSVKLQDWNSVVNAGMGGTVFQRALAQTAEAMGTLEKGTVKLTGPMKNVTIAGEAFRQSLSTPGKASWLTSDVLTKTLKQFTGDLKDAELAAMGFNDAQIKAIQQTAKTAMFAATEVKTISQVFDVAKETAASGWAQTFQIIFGTFTEAKKTFTAVSNAINGFINASADARNKVLGDWKALGGRTVLIDAIKTAFHNLGMILAPIKEAFRDIFPARTGKDLYELTVRFKEFTETLKPSPETVENLKRTFRGFFALLSIGQQIIRGIFTVFAQLFGVVGEGSGSFLNFTGNIGDFLVSVDQALKKGNRLQNFFEGIGKALATPIRLLGVLADALANLFSGFSPGGISDEVDGITRALTPMQRIVEGLTTAWANFIESADNIGTVLRPAFEAIISLISGLGTAIGQAASNMNFDAILQVIQTGLFAGIFLMFKKFLGKGSLMEQLGGAGGGILGNIAGSFDALRGSMVALQTNIKADTLKKIAIAIALLTASVVALSFVDPDRLKSSLTAMTVAFGQLLGAMAILGNITQMVGFIKMPVIAASMILLAGAITVLSAAVVILAQLSWEELAKGLGGVAALLAVISIAVIPLSANSAGMVRAGVGITAIAIALNLMALAVRQFASMNLTELGKGLGSIAVGLGIMIAAMKKMPVTGMISAGIGITALAVGLRLLGEAVEKFGGMNLRTIGQGLVAVGVSLGIIALAMRVMPKGMTLQAAALVLVAGALNLIAMAITKMGGMSIREVATGLIGLGGALAVLAGGLYLMSGTIGGAVALGIASAGIALLVPALTALGKLSWPTIIKGLVALGAAFAVIGVAGALITAAVPGLLGFGAAMALIGAGLALAGAGIFLISAGFSALVVALPTGVGVILAAFVEFTEGLIKNVKLLILGLLEIVRALAATAPQFVEALVKILGSLLDVIIQSSPKIAAAFTALLGAALQVLQDNQGKIIQAGFNLLVALLQGIRNNIPKLVSLVGDIIVKFLGTISSNLGRIITAGVNVLLSFVRGIFNNIGRVVTVTLDIITRFLSTIASNLGRIATAGLNVLTRFLGAIASNLGKVITAGTDIIVKFIEGIGNAGSRVITAARKTMTKLLDTLASESVKMADAGFKAIIKFMNGIADAINANAGAMRAAGGRIAFAIVDGLTFGLASKAGEVAAQAASLGRKALGALGGAVGIGSPSKEAFKIGGFIVDGLANGLADSTKAVSSAEDMGNGIINSFKDVFQITSPSKVMYEIGQAVGQGFANGLKGSGEDIKNAFTELNNKLTDTMTKARETIVSEQEKLDKLRASKKPDAAAIREAQETIKLNQDLLARSTAGHIALTKTLKDEKAILLGLAGDYERIGEKLNKAKDILATAIRTRDDAIKGYTDQYSALPPIVKEDAEGNAIDQLATYMQALDNQAKAITAYQSTLDQLRKLGLSDKQYQKLLSEGPEDQRFADQLLAGGKTAVTALNKLDTQLQTASKSLATQSAKNLYQAGVDAAQGIVNGLSSKKSAIRKEMEEIAREMLRALKKELGIKSPSEEFAEIGKFAMEGMALGFKNSSRIIVDAVDDAAKNALAVMKQSMRGISDMVSDELNPNPVITPILDLTLVQNQAEQLAALTKVTPITAAASYGQASIISSAQTATQADEVASIPGGTSVKFEQNNYSPEALTDIEIYRQTKNQLSQLKSVFSVT